MTAFSDEDCEKLIELIKQHPLLYNVQLESHRDENLKDNIWTNIAENINKTGELLLIDVFCIFFSSCHEPETKIT